MSQSKLNIFHFHIVDDQSFSYESLTYLQMSSKGAYKELHIYSQNDIKDIIEFAPERGIRIFVEFDTPSHTRS
ncbi:unnamed protein product [Rotaria sp. Silwood2]|nr:unnamed protein product [Rotaria sp. Silwood2]CAF2921572.1 unnamed protein product [Rotaria sp. Silwood2]CAF3333589.1 unnamed protein product [Rotaria sp. Silwood2]CAF4205631.1 unnamed protein product [Rotaria sp. Silwood2]CAF4307439.1 unnamed protein product [Rotaria sp. Silwood2]